MFRGQRAHRDVPRESLNLPDSQTAHVPPSRPVVPVPHTHAAALLLPAGDEPLAGQAVHGALPAVFLNVPGAHS